MLARGAVRSGLALVASVGVSMGLGIQSGGVAAAAPAVQETLRENVPPVPNYEAICEAAPRNGRACVAAEIAAINRARRLEKVPPLALPKNFSTDSAPVQLFVIVNLERVGRGLPPYAVLKSGLDKAAHRAAAAGTDPGWVPSSYRGALYLGGDWASGIVPPAERTANVLAMDYMWMYLDGVPNKYADNLACPHTGAAGCWGHRKNILLDQPKVGPVFVLGAGYAVHAGQASGTLLMAESSAPLGGAGAAVYTWAAAVRAGAGR